MEESKHNPNSSSRSCDIPEDLVIDILARLPVKSLIRFKSVCKTWSNIITAPSFVSTHLSNTRTPEKIRSGDTCGGVSVRRWDWLRDDMGEPDFLYDFLKLHVGDTIEYVAPHGANAGIVEDTLYSVVGYCDGVFCLSSRHLDRDLLYSQPGHIVIALCNPALRELRILPMSDSDFPPYRSRKVVDIDFGYDPKTNDYKVVKIVTFDGSDGLDILEVYSMTSNSWREVFIRGNDDYAAVQKTTAAMAALMTGTYTTNNGGGVLHWTMVGAYDAYEWVILSFHMGDDSLRVTRLPSKCTTYRRPIILFDNKPTIIYVSDTKIEVLQMKKELDADSWYVASTVERLHEYSKPLGFWKENVLLMFDCESHIPFLFNIATKQSTDLEETSEIDFFYTETLVSVKPP